MNDVEHLAVVKIDSDHGPIALGFLGFFHDASDAVAVHLSDAVGFGVFHLRQQDLGALPLMAELPARFLDAVFQNIVAQDQADAVAPGEMFGQPQRLGDSAGAFLIGVIQILQPEFMPVAEKP